MGARGPAASQPGIKAAGSRTFAIPDDFFTELEAKDVAYTASNEAWRWKTEP